jgi:hypothetical protein
MTEATPTKITKAPESRHGSKLFVSSVLAPQVNALTGQRIPVGAPVVANYDTWIEIQLAAGVLQETKL